MKRPAICKPTHQRTRAQTNRDFEKTRPNATDRGYGVEWRKARAAFLADNPLCVMCSAEDRIELANVVDHITPHRGDMVLFWDVANWQPLCSFHHNRHKHSQEMQEAAGRNPSGLL